jgi:hypothetical protein
MKRFCKKERARKAADSDEIRAEYGKNAAFIGYGYPPANP